MAQQQSQRRTDAAITAVMDYSVTATMDEESFTELRTDPVGAYLLGHYLEQDGARDVVITAPDGTSYGVEAFFRALTEPDDFVMGSRTAPRTSTGT